MSAGMLTLTNNSAVVTGSGTAFTTELTAGDFLVVTAGGITYTLPVQSVDSDTQLTLPSKYKGPAQSGLAWSVVPRATQNQITAALVAQTTEALRGQNYDKQNWQAVFSNSGDITVVLPDGSTFSGPSWRKIVDLLNSIDPDLIQTLATQIHADAQQVAADRTDIDTKASQVQIDAQAASTAASAATTANTTAQQAKADALTAKTAAEAARDAAQSANPDNQLKKLQNLADVSSIPAARSN
ncbi:MAG: tail fiber domain-containing protein, partial [Enterobacteriaceae bacterium]|nr:tail fiber domain-containing protein [Enterobacteriaceae bacterium]